MARAEDSNILRDTGTTDAELLQAVAILKGGTDPDVPENLTDVHTYVADEIEKLNISMDTQDMVKKGMAEKDAFNKATVTAAKKRKAVDKAMKKYLASINKKTYTSRNDRCRYFFLIPKELFHRCLSTFKIFIKLFSVCYSSSFKLHDLIHKTSASIHIPSKTFSCHSPI